jgi:hypothetical protein
MNYQTHCPSASIITLPGGDLAVLHIKHITMYFVCGRIVFGLGVCIIRDISSDILSAQVLGSNTPFKVAF